MSVMLSACRYVNSAINQQQHSYNDYQPPWEQFASLDGFSTGILTQTTPTLTPTTLRNIEQTFIELQSVPPTQIEHQNQAGFVPPVVHRTQQPVSQQQPPVSGSGSAGTAQLSTATPTPSRQAHPSPATNQTSYINSNHTTGMTQKNVNTTVNDTWSNGSNSASGNNGKNGRQTNSHKSGRSMGGRKPNKHEKLSPEEEERRRVRRERNKMAAARCRKRRLDHTNLLVDETNVLETKRSELQQEITVLTTQKEELEYILETHKLVCKIAKLHHLHLLNDTEDIKPSLVELNRALMSASPGSTSSSNYSSSTSSVTSTTNTKVEWEKKTPIVCKSAVQRPNSLPLTSTFVTPSLPSITTASLNTNNTYKSSITEATGISISTPSNGIFNFDALMEGGTGLTPVNGGTGLTPMVPTCSTQQRSSSSDLSSPDSITPSKLVSL
ncbi:hypothetical protein CHUAL_001103 [Chamberlinius hualienensis]